MAQVDHDYKGHRVAAMGEIETAGKELGISVSGRRQRT
ncbi:hypothetical protein SBV1_620006 [Verrucomicrobia bacterium]|nr:hypothetical protein SBV1_620006 [Verrucomicrobiota bacterium]